MVEDAEVVAAEPRHAAVAAAVEDAVDVGEIAVHPLRAVEVVVVIDEKNAHHRPAVEVVVDVVVVVAETAVVAEGC